MKGYKIEYECYTEKGYDCQVFDFEGRESIVVFPKNKTDDKKRWALKTEYFNAFPYLEYELLEKGFHIAFITNDSRWGTREELDIQIRFADYIIKEYGLNEQFLPIGMSCGGIFAIKLASIYENRCPMIYIDAPVLNLLSLAGFGEYKDVHGFLPEMLGALNISQSELISFRDNPLDHLKNIISKKIPTVLVYGALDSIVSPRENAQIIEKAFKKTDIPFLCIVKPDCDHHPHSLEDCSQVVDFILKYYN